MGLDLVVEGTAHHARWSYSGFNRFRKRLAEQLGFSLDQMVGFGGDVPWNTVSDPIVPLLDHSDCEGELSPLEAASVAPRLREMVAGWDEGDYDREQAERLAAMCDYAASAGVPVMFY